MGAGMEDPEDAIDDRSKIVKGMACLAVMSTVRQEGRDPRPLWLGDFLTLPDCRLAVSEAHQ